MQVLNRAAKAAHEAKFHALQRADRWSQWPVMETTFWDEVFKLARSPDTAEKVLDELQQIEEEPCYDESERVQRSVAAARRLAKAALLS